MIFNALIAAMTSRNLDDKKVNKRTLRNKYIIEKYQERSIANRYFK